MELWICGACGSAESVDPWSPVDLQSPGSMEPRSVEPRIHGARAILAPTGMAAYHINGNTIHSGLHININKKELAPLNDSELNIFSNMILANEHRSLDLFLTSTNPFGI